MTTIAVLKAGGDARAAATPDTVKKMTGLGLDVVVEAGAGTRAGLTDSAYEAAGARVAANALEGADAALVVEAPTGPLPEGLALIGQLNPYDAQDRVDAWAKARIDAFAMELVPRISRAQSMDVLSSQANLAGYKAVIDAASAYGRAFPMMMTAAGTVPPAKVFVMGAGVAGLQAIATAKRLGAVVSATDVRIAAKEQIESLGGTFVVADEEAMRAMEGEGGYAKEAGADFQAKQAAHVKKHLEKMDVVVTTALMPGRPAPKLVTADMVRRMKPGAVIVDVAIDQGGCCETSRATTHAEPTYVVDDVVHYCVANMPGGVPKTSTYALNNATLAHVLTLADKGYRQALGDDPHLGRGLNVHAGRLTSKEVAESLSLDFVPVEEALRG